MTLTIPGLGGLALGDLSDRHDHHARERSVPPLRRRRFVNAVVSWTEMGNKPATFTTAAHTHAAHEIAATAIETISGTACTRVAADHAKWKRTSDASGVTITIDATPPRTRSPPSRAPPAGSPSRQAPA